MKEELLSLLQVLNEDMEGKLIQIGLENYVDKIIENATLITIYKNRELQGFIAFYANDLQKENAFLTMLAVKKEKKNMGYGKILLELSIKELTKMGFRKYSLEVYYKNHLAINLYEKYDFKEVNQKGSNIFMEKQLTQC